MRSINGERMRRAGRVAEVFACGTAAVISAIGTVRYAGGAFRIGDGEKGPVTRLLYDQLMGIQRGKIADRHGWMRRVV